MTLVGLIIDLPPGVFWGKIRLVAGLDFHTHQGKEAQAKWGFILP